MVRPQTICPPLQAPGLGTTNLQLFLHLAHYSSMIISRSVHLFRSDYQVAHKLMSPSMPVDLPGQGLGDQGHALALRLESQATFFSAGRVLFVRRSWTYSNRTSNPARAHHQDGMSRHHPLQRRPGLLRGGGAFSQVMIRT